MATTRSSDDDLDADLVILGGGIAGLTSAIGLLESGLRIVVVEASRRLGGRAQSFTDPLTGDTVDIGPHVLFTEYRNLLRLLELLGTRADLTWQDDTFITLVEGRRSLPVKLRRLPAPLHFLPSLLGTRMIGWRDLLSNLRATWLAMNLDEGEMLRLDRRRADEVLQESGVSRRFLEWYWASASMSILNVPLERCSAGALLRFYQLMIGYDDYRVGFPRHGLNELFAPQAAGRIVAGGGRLLFGSPARALRIRDGQVTGVRLDDGTRIAAPRCIAALPPRELHAILPADWAEGRFADLRAFEPSRYISSYIWFERKLTTARFWARVWSPDNLNYDSYDLSNIRPDWSQRGSIIASNIIHSQRAGDMSDEQVLAATLRELADFVPAARDATIRHTRVHRIPMAIPCPYPGTECTRPDAATPVAGLWLAGDWTRTGLPMSMESAARSGWLAAERVWADLGRPRELAQGLRPMSGLVGWLQRRRARR